MPPTDVTSAASALQASPGAYALLLGSGTSRSAGIPTGWEIALDLIRRLAAAAGIQQVDDPQAWYAANHDEDPDYSKLLEYLAPGQGDRQALLAPYFTPTAEEQAEGLKAPTAAHRAIARLVQTGIVKVIATTNFDRLLEQALEDVGVQPLVVSTTAGADNVPPLHAIRCLIIKVHGDQASPDLRNTLAELGSYDEPMERLLTRVLGEHGLVVCGWSATWDPALRKLLMENRSAYYTTFWAVHDTPSNEAQEVLQARLSMPLAIADASTFFEELAGKVEAIASLAAARPTGPDVAVAELKRYLDNPTARIRLRDLVTDQVRAALDATGADRLPVLQHGIPAGGYDAHLAVIENEMATVVPLLVNLGFYASSTEHDDLAVGAIRQLATRPMELAGTNVLVMAQRYPALLGLYALGLGALANRRVRPMARALTEVVPKDNSREVGLAYFLAPTHVLLRDALRKMEEFLRHHTPASDRLHARLRPYLVAFLPTEDDYDAAFDNLEYLIGLDSFRWSERWGPVGRFKWRRAYPERGAVDQVLQLHEPGILEAGMFSGSAVTLAGVKAGYDSFLAGVHYS